MAIRPLTSAMIGPPIPAHPRRAHVPWHDPRCDQLAILDMAVRDGSRRADINVCATRDGEIGLHWPESARRNGYGFIARAGIRRRMTPEELSLPVAAWSTADVRRWRKTRLVSQRNGRHRPRTIPEWQRAARKRRVLCMYELKSPQLAEVTRARRMAAQIRASGWPAWVMTLVTMRRWADKMRAFHQAGLRTALLTEHVPEPAEWPQAKPYVERLLGRFTPRRKAA